MGNIMLVLNDNTEQKFRALAMKVHGNRKGAISNAGMQAIEEWIERNE